MKIIINALPKTGSTVISHILKDIYNLVFIPQIIYSFYRDFLNQLKRELSYKIKASGGIDIIVKDGIYLGFEMQDDNYGVYKVFNVFLKNEIIKYLSLENKNLILRTHEKCNPIIQNSLFKNFKKIYVIRNIFDTIHSNMKFIDNTTESFKIIQKYKSQYYLAYYRYKNINKFLGIIEDWKLHVKSYLKNREEYILIKYEDFISSPYNTIEKVCNFIAGGNKIDKKKIEEVVNNNLFKEIVKTENVHKYYKHYNEGKKIGDFNRFFTDKMIKIVINEVGDLMKELGYNVDELIDSSSKKYESIQELDKIYNEYYKQNLSLNDFLNYLNEITKVPFIIYGFGQFAKEIVNYLENINNILYIVDDHMKIDFVEVKDKKIKIKKELDQIDKNYKIIVPVNYNNFSLIKEKILKRGINEDNIVHLYNVKFDQLKVIPKIKNLINK